MPRFAHAQQAGDVVKRRDRLHAARHDEVPTGPGLGVELDREKFGAAAEAFQATRATSRLRGDHASHGRAP